MVAGGIDVRDTEAMMIIYALEPVLTLGCARDPYFEYLFPDVADAMDLPELTDSDLPADLPDVIADTNVFFVVGQPDNPRLSLGHVVVLSLDYDNIENIRGY